MVTATKRETERDYPAMQEELEWPGKHVAHRITKGLPADLRERAHVAKLTAPQVWALARKLFPADFTDADDHVRKFRLAQTFAYLRDRRGAELAAHASHHTDAKRQSSPRSPRPIHHAEFCRECYLPSDLCEHREPAPRVSVDYASVATAPDITLADD